MLDDAYGFEPSIRDLFASRYTDEQLAVFLEPLREAAAGSSIYMVNKTVEAHTVCCYLPVINYLAKTGSKKRQLILVGTSQKSHALMKELLPLAKSVSIDAEELIEPVPGVQPEYREARGTILVGTMKAYLTQAAMQPGLEAELETLVCDDLPGIINMGYEGDLKNLFALIPQGWFFLFSREENSKAEAILKASLPSVKTLVIEDKVISLEVLPQEVYHVNKQEKIPLLLGLAAQYGIKRAIVVCNQKSTVEYIAKKLEANGIPAGWILSYVSRKEQKETLDSFDEGKIAVLVTNDRSLGYINAKAPFIINYDIPQTPEAYKLRLHHADNSPSKKAISFACEEFVYGLPAIEAYLGFKLPVSGFEQSMLKEDKAKHIQEYRGYGFGRDSGFGRDRGGRGDRRDSSSRDRYSRDGSGDRARSGSDRGSFGSRDGSGDRARSGSDRGSFGSRDSSGDRARSGSGDRPDRGSYSDRRGPPSRDGSRDGSAGSSGGNRPRRENTDRGPRETRQPQANADNSKLYTMSAEERLKLYQKKYAGRYEQGRDKNADQADRKRGPKQSSGQNRGNQGKPAEQRNNSGAKPAAQGKSRDQQAKREPSGQEPKQGNFLQGILSIFKPKKDPKDKD